MAKHRIHHPGQLILRLGQTEAAEQQRFDEFANRAASFCLQSEKAIRGPRTSRHRVSNPNAGMIGMQMSIRFIDWISERRTMPTHEDVAAHFEVSRATAYRWISAFCAARCINRERAVAPNGADDAYIPMAIPPGPKPRYLQWVEARSAH